MLKKVLVLLVCLCCAWPCLGEETQWQPIPEALRFSYVIGERETLGYKTYLRKSYPETKKPEVNREILALVDELASRPELLPGKCQEQGYLEVNCRISRSGQSMMSFLVLASRAEDLRQTGVAFENRVYDMKTGERVLLSRLFDDDSEAWACLAEAVKQQLTAYYPNMDADEATLAQLCEKESLQSAAFSLTPVQLELHFASETLYPGTCTLMHVRVPYRTLRPYMNDYALAQTDNNGYQLAALTYDDGPVRNTSHRVMDQLMAHGANATFFVVGTRLKGHREILCREQDSGFQVASHNWEHVYNQRDRDVLLGWKERFDQTMSDICGAVPTMMRAPGGIYGPYQTAKVDLPLIQWSLISGDASDDKRVNNAVTIAGNVRSGTDAGSIVLMHDLNHASAQYSKDILDRLEERNILCVTVEELLIHYGIEAQGGQVYFGFEECPVPAIGEGSNAT